MHHPVMLNRTIENLLNERDGFYVDCTTGGGGHLRALLHELNDKGRILAIDRDQETLERTAGEINDPRVIYKSGDFRYLANILSNIGREQVNGILLDLGVSSFQLDDAERGFSFHQDAILDMRMNRSESYSALQLINECSEQEIRRILYVYGEEKYARSIARAIVKNRGSRPIQTTMELVDIIKSAVPSSYQREKHPARKTFQALRIEVNQELEALKEVLPQTIDALQPGGRLCIITFHSLEDRIVKQFLQQESKECICPPGLPVCTCGHKARLKLINRKALKPDAGECQMNPRARSAKLRVASRI